MAVNYILVGNVVCFYMHLHAHVCVCVCVCVFVCTRMHACRHSLSVSPRAEKCDPHLQMQLCLRGSHLISTGMWDGPKVMWESGRAAGSFSMRNVLHLTHSTHFQYLQKVSSTFYINENINSHNDMYWCSAVTICFVKFLCVTLGSESGHQKSGCMLFTNEH